MRIFQPLEFLLDWTVLMIIKHKSTYFPEIISNIWDKKLHKLTFLAYLDKHENKLQKWILAYFNKH
jgi:hypothetical protein